VHEGKSVPLGGRRQRSLLAILLLRANEVVSNDALIDELWGEQPPASARHTLHAYVSRLRKLLREHGGDEHILVSYPAGYLLRVGYPEFDLNRFEHLAEEGRRALATGAVEEAAATCRAALSLWTGPALADLRFESFARVDVERLEEQRLGVLEDRIEADLKLGEHAALVAPLEALVAAHPLRERLREEVMLALYRSGRQAEALEAYRSARTYMVEECGLEPGKQLQALHQAILDQDAKLDLQMSRSTVLTAKRSGDDEPPLDLPDRPAVEAAASAPPRPPDRRRGLVVGAAALAVAVAVGVLVITSHETQHTLHASSVRANSVVFVDPGRAKLVRQAGIGGRPTGIVAGFGRIWVTDSANARVLVLDPETFRIEDQIPVGRDPTALVASSSAIWVTDPGSGTVSEISSGSHTVVATVPVGTSPAAIGAGAGALWVADASSGALTRIDPKTATVVDTISVGQPLTDVTVGLGSVWATSASSGLLIAVNPQDDRVTQAIAIGNGPSAVRVVDAAVWVANPPDDTLSRFDPATGRIRKLNVAAPTALTVVAGYLWVVDGGALTRIAPATDKSTHIAALANPATALSDVDGKLAVLTGVSPAEHAGGTLQVVAGSGIDSIDPGAAYSANDWQILSMTNDGLLTYARSSTPSAAVIVPDLATSLPLVHDGGRTFTFTVRRGVRYSDGTLLRPEDFRRALERQYQAGTGLSAMGVPVTGAEQCGPDRCDLHAGVTVNNAAWTVTYHLSAPDPTFLYQLALPFGAAVPAGAPAIGAGTHPLPATGPYRIASYVANQTLVLVRNPQFHAWSAAAQPTGFPAQISVRLGLDADAQAAAVAAGHADVTLDSPPSSALAKLSRDLPQQLHTYAQGVTDAMFLNTRLAPFDRPSVRRAIALAVDRGRIVELAGGSQLARPTCQILPPQFPGYYPHCTSTTEPGPAGVWHRAALSQAQALIRASGTSGMSVTVSTNSKDPFKLAVGRYFVDLLNTLGYDARLRTYPDEHSYYAQVGLGKAHSQIGFFGWAADYQAGSAFFGPLFTCAAYQPAAQFNVNPAGYCDPQIDHRITEATTLQTVNVAAANRAWRTIDATVTDAGPWVPLVNPLGIVLVSARVGNYQRNPAFGILLDQLWVR
jgi:ABC-type transport system substrate-binding protein/DNA-binding SARP family transcriptional activator